MTGQVYRIGAIVLAAGGASRMGELKQLLPVGGQPMVRRVAEAVCAAVAADEGGQVVVVVGARAEAVTAALAGLPVEVVVNEVWAEGLSSSLRAGLSALRPEIQATLVVLADQPALTPDLLKTLVARYRATGAPLVVPFYQGRRGNPVLVDRCLFTEMQTIEGDRGARVLLARYQGVLNRVDVDDPAVVNDVDTREEYERAKGLESTQ